MSETPLIPFPSMGAQFDSTGALKVSSKNVPVPLALLTFNVQPTLNSQAAVDVSSVAAGVVVSLTRI
jgi:hypothetical protein